MLHDERQNDCEDQPCKNPPDGCSELAEFDSQKCAQVLSPELYQIRCSLATNIDRHHDSFIHRLPFELVSRVLIFCVEEVMEQTFSHPRSPLPKLALSPLQLGNICRAWREIAWATQQLWKTVHLSVRNVPQMSKFDLVHQWLSRSGQQPLSITLICLNFPEMLQDVHESIFSLFGAIRDHSYHWRRMQLFVPPECLGSLLGNGGIDGLPLLEDLKVHRSFHPTLHSRQDVHLVNTPFLMRVKFENLYLQNISLEWKNITFVDFACLHIDEIFQILRLAPRLTACKFATIVEDSGDYPMDTFTHGSLRTLHIQPEENQFDPDLEPFFSNISFPSLVDFTYDSSLSRGQFPVDGLLGLFDRSQCSITHFSLAIRKNGAWMDEEDLISLLKKLPTVTHLSLLNFDLLTWLLTDPFLRHFAQTLHGNVDVFLPHLQVLKYEGWRSFSWKELADMCYSRSTPTIEDGARASKHFTPLRCLEFMFYIPGEGNHMEGDYIDFDCIPLFKQVRVWGTTITIYSNIYKGSGRWEMVDLLQFA